MKLELGKLIFPNYPPWRRRWMMRKIKVAAAGSTALVVIVAVTFWITNHGRFSFFSRSRGGESPASDLPGR